MAHISELKKQVVKRLRDLISQYDIIATVNMENLPAAQLQQMRTQLRGKIELIMTKRRLMKVAIKELTGKKKGIEQLEQHLQGMPALIFTKENPFSLFKTLKKSKSQAPAKAGQTAPNDIEVKAGPTSFAPGPVIGELGAIGIKCGVEGGKVAIKEDSIVVKAGEVINRKQAEILTRLGIEPMEVGLNITAVYEKGVIYTKDVLDIDEEEFNNKLSTAASEALNLSAFIAYPTKDTIELLIQSAFNDALALGLSQEIIDDQIIEELLGKAEISMLSLKSTANIQVPEKQLKPAEAKEPKKEEVKKVPKENKVEEKTEIEESKKETKEEVTVSKEEKKVEPAPKVMEKKEEVPKREEPKETKEEETKVVPEIKEETKEEIKAETKEKPKEEKSETIKPRETPQEQKKEAVLEKEKEIIKEEEKLEKEEPKTEAPVEREVKEIIKEKEEKQLEKERIDTEKEFEKIEPKKETTENKVADMVAKIKKHATGKAPTADKIIEDIKKEEPKEKPIEDAIEVPSAHELAQKKKIEEHKKAEEFTKELLKKGTLRK